MQHLKILDKDGEVNMYKDYLHIDGTEVSGGGGQKQRANIKADRLTSTL